MSSCTKQINEYKINDEINIDMSSDIAETAVEKL
jgi:hypothetical protein